ncbi:MAG: CPBP family intramembrane metalloprotease [Candidatus Zixiibacteriota bacterium]|nr:MAG: CPBP family intramembrane metalloprotease [candidate division Zixibacteria bacterium]
MTIRSIFLSDKGLRLLWNIILYLVIVVVFTAAFAAPVVAVLSLLDLSPQIGKAVTGWRSIIGSVITLVIGYAGFILGNHLAQKWLNKSNLKGIGLRTGTRSVKLLILGVILGGLIVGVAVSIDALFGWYTFTGFAWQFRPADLVLATLVLILFTKIQSALVEEVIFRGYLLELIADRFNLKAAVISTSILFGLSHLTSLADEFPWWAAILSTLLAGLVFAQAYVLYRNLFLPVGIHYGWVLFGRLLNDTGGPAGKSVFLASSVSGPSLVTPPPGGGASLFELVGVGIVALILWRMSKVKSGLARPDTSLAP